MNSKKILFVIPDMQQGGAERVVSVMANYWVERGHAVGIMSFDNGESYYKLNEKITVHPLHSAKKIILGGGFIVNNISRFFNYIKQVKKIKPDIIISFTDNANVYCLLYNRFLRKPLIITQRTNPHFSMLPGSIKNLPGRIYKKAAAMVVQTAETLKIYKSLNIELPKKTAIIYNPLSPSSYADAGVAGREKIILAVGRLNNSHKHFDKLTDIFSSINNEGWQLQIAGDGEDRQMLETKIRQLNLEDKIILLGGVKDLTPLYQSAKIFVLTSQFEGFPNALCEAMANGCACISYDCATGPAEIITPEENGILIELGNEKAFAQALYSLMTDEAKMQSLSYNALKIRERLDENKIMKEWESLIDEVLQ